MKVTFKSYDDIKNLMTDSKSVKTKATWDKTTYLGGGFDKDLDAFLKTIAGKTFEIEDYQIIGNGDITFKIQTCNVGEDGGFNTNTPFGDFNFTKAFVDSIDEIPEGMWFCRICGMTVDSNKELYPFDPKNTYAEFGIDKVVCPACFTKTYNEVKFNKS